MAPKGERGAMIKIMFESGEMNQLHDISKNHPHPHVRNKALALLQKSQGIKHHQICGTLGISENTLRTYFKQFLKRRIESITMLNFRKPESRLISFETEIKTYLEKSPPSTIKQACSEIKGLTGVELKETQMRKYLKKLGADFRKVGGLPAKTDIEKQKNFLENELNPRLDQAKANARSVYFIDAAHFVLGAFLGYLWCLARVFVRTPSGRQRFNVLGALNAVTKELTTITNNTYITSTQVCELLRLIAQNSTLPITVVLDNARYQRCDLVIALAQELNIELLFLPPYSPNLNLIERVWKFTKKHCLNSKYYPKFSDFHGAIDGFLTNMHNTHTADLNTLLTLNFQTFTETQFTKAI
jgi:transposase